jgi:hypothetical protein
MVKGMSNDNHSISLVAASKEAYKAGMFLLERFAEDINNLCDDPEFVKEVLRRDLIALHDACNAVHPDLWREHLLHEPPGTQARERYQQRLQVVPRSQLIAELAGRRACNEEEAARLCSLFATGGIRDVIAWRCGTARYDFGIIRIRRILTELIVGFPAWAQERSTQFIGALWHAICDSTAPFHLEPLLTEYPSSDYRLRLSRRLPWSRASAASQHQKGQKERSAWPPPSPLARRVQTQQMQELVEDPLLASFRTQLSMTSSQGQYVLRRIITLGVLGCFSSEELPLLFNAQHMSWLRMIEFGRPDGRILWDKIYVQLQVDAHLRQITPPAKQVARALFNSFATPRYWSLGKGSVTDGRVRHSPALYDAGLPQANDTWIAFGFSIIIGTNWRRQQRYRMACIADYRGELVMGGWLTADNGTENDLGLALYQAIWHVGNLQWPFRGLPRRIIVPRSLVGNREGDLRAAAAYLLADLDIVDRISLKGKSRLVSARDTLRKEAIQLLSIGNQDRKELPIVLQHILEALRTQEYALQRSASVPRDLRRFGMAMPGFDTLAAGFLLPHSSQVAEVYDNGVRHRTQWYRADQQSMLPGQQLVARIFPVSYPHTEPDGHEIGIFVEVDRQGEPYLQYLAPAHD